MTGMTPEPRRIDTNDRWLDEALSSAIPAHSRWIVARCVVMVLCSTAILLFMPGDSRFVAAAAIALTGLLQPVVWLTAPRANRVTVHACSDFVLIFFIVAIEPAVWAPGLFFAGAILGWQALTAQWRTTTGLAIVALVGMTTAGILADIDSWVLGPVAVVVVTPILTGLGRGIRQELVLKQSDLSFTLSSIGAVVRNFDLDTGKSLTVEGDFEALTGWTLHEWKGLDYKSLIHPDDREGYWIDADAVRDGQHVDRVGRLRRPDGSWTWIRDVGLISVDHNGRRSMHGFAVDVTDMQEANQLIARQAMEDSLTGLANRRRLFVELDQLNQACTPLALFMIDLDLFKKVNDSLGHEAGDRLLQFVAGQLRDLIGDDGLVARLGGDEFAIVYPGLTTEADTAALVAKIRSATSEPFALASAQVSISLSIGVDLSDGLVDGTTLLRHADIAMYEAKEHGLPYQLFDITLDRSSSMTLSLGSALHDAIETEQLQLSFQPKCNLATGAVVGAEGLIRWHHPQFGVLTPDKFLDLAVLSEQSSGFAMLTIEQAARMARRLIEAGRPMPIAVNLTMRVLRSADLVDATTAILRRHNVPPEFLTVEITENDTGWPTSQVAETIRGLRTAGIMLSIDDFGTGQSSLERLRSLHVDEVKIDRTFVSYLDERPVERELVATIIDLARRLGYGIVAEGVERKEESDLLQAMGCQVAQGYLFSRALPADEFFVVATGQRSLTEPHNPARQACSNVRASLPYVQQDVAADRRQPSPDQRGLLKRAAKWSAHQSSATAWQNRATSSSVLK